MKPVETEEIQDLLDWAMKLAHESIPEVTLDPSDMVSLEIDLDTKATPRHTTPPKDDTPPPVIRRWRRSEKISLRVPGPILAAFKAEAKRLDIPYQRLINRALKSAAGAWSAS